MYVKSLALDNFRNYKHMELPLSPGINILYGDNAQGKTNILEALYLCATTKSHRGSKDREMIRFGTDESHIRMIYSKKGIDHRIDMHLRRGRAKAAAIDRLPIRRAGELMGQLHMICFSPEDLSMIKNGPAQRRRFLDMEMCQLSNVYLHDLSDYNKTVNQRNNLLRQIAFSPSLEDTLDVWDAQLIRYGQRVAAARAQFIEKLNRWVAPLHEKLSGGTEELKLLYRPDTAPEEFEKKLKAVRENDLRLKTTTAGPHRDDFIFQINGIDVRRFGSQGQQRTAALSLKLSEIELVRETIEDDPVLLLDDVFSELDASRQKYLISCIQDVQTIVTCTGMDEFIDNRLKIDCIFNVAAGSITKREELHE